MNMFLDFSFKKSDKIKAVAAMQGADQHIKRRFGFSILLKDTLTCSQGEPGFEPATFQLWDDLLYILSNSLRIQ